MMNTFKKTMQQGTKTLDNYFTEQRVKTYANILAFATGALLFSAGVYTVANGIKKDQQLHQQQYRVESVHYTHNSK